MTRQELYNKLVKVKNTADIFGEVEDKEALRKVYIKLARIIHPDTASDREKYISNEGFKALVELYEKAQEEIEKGIYNIKNTVDLYNKITELFKFSVGGKEYKLYENIYQGEISDIYRGTCDNDIICLKTNIDSQDNDLIKEEYNTLNSYSHHSLPIVRDLIKINDCYGIIEDEIIGENLVDIMYRNNQGLNPEVVMWIMERLFSVVGYLHSNYIVHSNITPENIVINKLNHNVVLTGFGFHIPNANTEKARYKIRNAEFSAPEVDKSSRVGPESDIYSLGKLAIYMLGGNIYNNGMPINIDLKIREFIRKLVETDRNKRSGDAWKLWDMWREIRTKVYGDTRFKQINF